MPCYTDREAIHWFTRGCLRGHRLSDSNVYQGGNQLGDRGATSPVGGSQGLPPSGRNQSLPNASFCEEGDSALYRGNPSDTPGQEAMPHQ